jgi:hypothetical protein
MQHGIKWTVDDENKLVESLKAQESVLEICRKYQRTPGGIKSRIRLIIQKLLISGKSDQEIAEYFDNRLPMYKIREAKAKMEKL